jgi:hypothetical protein
MKLYFYQANFCAECGNAMTPRFSWGPRYFCDTCARQMGRGAPIRSIVALALGATFVVTALHRTDPPRPAAPPLPPAALEVSAHDASALSRPVFRSDAATRVRCGARTKKGTPCKNPALPGERCARHRGMVSILEPSSTR